MAAGWSTRTPPRWPVGPRRSGPPARLEEWRLLGLGPLLRVVAAQIQHLARWAADGAGLGRP
eukprot:8439938-Alexandrium_andersonii.AAC.1